MMTTEMKWPGWPELPFLLLFFGVVLLVALVLLEGPGSGTDGESRVGRPTPAPEGRESQ